MSETHPPKVEETAALSARERQLAGLRPIKKGEVRNPNGNNGRRRGEYVAAWLEAEDSKDPEKRKRIDVVLEAEYIAAQGGDTQACKNLREAYGGKPKQQVDVTSDDETLTFTRADEIAAAAIAMIEAGQPGKDGDGAA